MNDYLVKIVFGPETWIGLRMDGTWEPSHEDAAPLARMATRMSRPPLYEYSPAHGSFGPFIAHQIAAKIGGMVKVPEATEMEAVSAGIVF